MARHPLQRVTSPSRTASLLFHLIGLLSFRMSFNDLNELALPISNSYGSHYQFLTILGLAAATLSFFLAFVADLTLLDVFFQAKNAIAVVATPVEVVVSILYWGIYAIDPALLFPDEWRMPLRADTGFHLAPAVFLTLDLIIFSPPWTIPAYGVMMLSTVLAFGYWYWVELCFSVNGWYPYPIFAILDTSQRAMLFVLAAFIATLSSIGLKWLYGRINGQESMRREAHKPLKKVP